MVCQWREVEGRGGEEGAGGVQTHEDRDGGDGGPAGGDQRVEEVQHVDRRRRRQLLVLRGGVVTRMEKCVSAQISDRRKRNPERTHVFDGLQGDLFAEQAEVKDGRLRKQVQHRCRRTGRRG